MNQKISKNDKLLQTHRASFCGRHVICDTFAAVALTIPLVVRYVIIDSDLSAAPDDVAGNFLIGIGLFEASGIGLLQSCFLSEIMDMRWGQRWNMT